MIQIALIIGTTRPNRFADQAAQWTVDGAKSRTDFTLSVLDLRDYALPFFAEAVTPTMSKGVYTDPEAEKWRRKIGEFDGYIATAAEYNHGPAAVLKNALIRPQRWNRKPITFVGYGATGAPRGRTCAPVVSSCRWLIRRRISPEPFLASYAAARSWTVRLPQSKPNRDVRPFAWWKALKIAREEAAAAACRCAGATDAPRPM
jgi:hypothetical protein